MRKLKKIFDNNFQQTLTIAEIGVNHDGNFAKAKKLINYAKQANFTAVKFQIYKTEKLLKKSTPLAEYQKSQKKSKNMFDLLEKYKFTYDQFYNLKKYCDKINISFLATPFDNDSAEFLNDINTEVFKISSGDLNNFYLLNKIKMFNKPIIISTGMSELNVLKNTLKFLNCKKNKLAILHCISSYPTNLVDTQLSNINRLKKFGYPVGFSDHTIGIEAAIAAISIGAKIIEKHITLDVNLDGPDHSSSLEVNKLPKFIKHINDLTVSINFQKRRLNISEKKNKKLVTRSLYFSRDLKENHVISFKDLIPLRPFNNGYPIEKFKTLIGKKIKYSVKSGSLIKKNII
jgi:N,N'-diacetyllegionaminate synthase